ncbi:transcription initiation factor TFIID subunit 2-like, partial [Carica papaya]|uniref:transcription initiation factor TFIID subunit 2-like n=1 Tax=Carica papaya TaxID=3649 RepID=UPI000B8CCD00
MGFSYNKRKNIVEMAVLRGCTATPDSSTLILSANPDSENRDGDVGWPGIMSIRFFEIDGMSDHPKLPMSGDTWQLLEIQCHSKLVARRYQKPKKGAKPDGSDDNGEVDTRSSMDSPLSWIRADPEMEYLAEIHLHQPVQMWINQLERDEDVVAQAQAIMALESLPQLSFSTVNALNNFLSDSKAFWRVRIDAAFALAKTASEETDWAGLLHLVKFYKGRRFDTNIGLPKPNDFRDFPEYFVLEAIPHAVAMVRAADKKSPREAVEFVLQLLKYNDNTGNPYSDVFWLAAFVDSVGNLEFGQQNIFFLSSLLKRIDRLLQFDRLMPSYNGILTISCIRTLTQIAHKLSALINLDHVFELIKPFRDSKALWLVRVEANRALLDIEFYCKGLNSALLLFIKFIMEEPTLRGQIKMGVHAMRLCQTSVGSGSNDEVDSVTLVALLHLLESRIAFNNVFLRHYLFCILRILGGRSPTLLGVPRDKSLRMGDMETCSKQKNIFAALIAETKPPEPSAPLSVEGQPAEPSMPLVIEDQPAAVLDSGIRPPEPSSAIGPEIKMSDPISDIHTEKQLPERPADILNQKHDNSVTREASKEVDAVSISHEKKKPVVKIRVRQSAATSRAETDNRTVERSQGVNHDIDRGATSSVSVDAPQRHSVEAVSISNQNLEEVNSCHDRGSRMTASIGSAKIASEGDNFGKELQCTADSGKISAHPRLDDPSSPSIVQDNNVDTDVQKYTSLNTLSECGRSHDGGSLSVSLFPSKEKERKKDKEKKRKREGHREGHRDDPENLGEKASEEREKTKGEEMAKLLSEDAK